MNKIFKYLLLVILFFFLFIEPVYAEEDCGTIDTKINNYNLYDEQLKGLDCSNQGDEHVVSMCNELKLNKNSIVANLMKLKDENKICSSKEEAVDKIIEANEDHCGKVLDDDITNLINRIMTIFYIIGPILLIVFGSLDYAKATVAGDEKSLKKANKTFFKRLLATVLLFLSPIITNFIINLNASEYFLSGNAYACDYEYSIYSKDWNIKFVQKQIKNGSTTSTGYQSTSITSKDGQAIAESAKQIKEYVMSNNYSYGSANVTADLVATDAQKTKTVVCATLVAASIYRANIYDVSVLNYGINSAPSTAKFLLNQGWQLIENAEDLRPGDILFYQKLVDPTTATPVTINGESIHTCHTDIYYGDGKKITTGGDFDRVFSDFYVDTKCYGVKAKWRYAFRYPGKE